MSTAVIYILISVLLSAIGQILLKRGMNSLGEVTLRWEGLLVTLWQMGSNLNVFLGLAFYVAGTVFWLAALSRVDLSYAYPFASLNYVIMLAASWLLLDEKVTIGRLVGTVVIGAGVLLIYRN